MAHKPVKIRPYTYLADPPNGEIIKVVGPTTLQVSLDGVTHDVTGLTKDIMDEAKLILSLKAEAEQREKDVFQGAETEIIDAKTFGVYREWNTHCCPKTIGMGRCAGGKV